MSFKKLQEFIDLAKESGVSELKYDGKDGKFELKFPVAGQASSAPVLNTLPTAAPVAAGAAPAAARNDGHVEVTSPFVGTFYQSPSPEAAAYVKVGDRVSKGQVLCIVEAMKIMNEIESEVAGEIVEICVENENYCEFGQVLYRIKP